MGFFDIFKKKHFISMDLQKNMIINLVINRLIKFGGIDINTKWTIGNIINSASSIIVSFGISTEFYWLLGLYLLIQVLDGNILVPFLFSARNKLHPVVIVISVLFFGGIWGFWGLLFGIT